MRTSQSRGVGEDVSVSFGQWWKRKSGGAKTVVGLAALLMVQIGLCFSTGWTVQPAYKAIFGPSSDPELGLGLMIWQGLLCGVTILALVIATVVVGVGGGFAAKDNSKGDPHD